MNPFPAGAGRSVSYTYDILGRKTQCQRVIGATTYTTSYSYNLASELTKITYPSGRAVQQTVDAIGRLSSVADPTTTYVSGFGYNTAGEATGFNYGNGVTAALGYSSDRLQLTSLSYSNSSGYLFNLSYGYTQNQSGNDGLITNITDNMDSGRSVSYTYDAFYRLASATTAGSTAYPAWGLSWTYDLYGNRTAQSIASGCTGLTCPTNSLTVSATTNQITGTGVGYDPSGNMTGDGLNTLTYDAAGRLISSSNGSTSGTYSYDGKGHRVQKVAGSTTTVYIFSGGKVLDEYDNGAAVSSPTREYIYSGGKMIAKISGGATTYYHSDHLSTRLITNSTGTVVEQLGHFAFGEQWYDSGSEKYKFTTYERDAESGTGGGTGNDYAMARYNVNRLGRFSSPDPLSGSVITPQSLNHYAYAGNNPINAIDPTGRDEFLTDCGDTHNGNGDEFCHPATGDCNGVDYCTDGGEEGAAGGNGGAAGGGAAGGGASSGGNNQTGSCVYLNDNANGVETIDPNSTAAECAENGGAAFSPGPGIVDPNSVQISDGSVVFFSVIGNGDPAGLVLAPQLPPGVVPPMVVTNGLGQLAGKIAGVASCFGGYIAEDAAGGAAGGAATAAVGTAIGSPPVTAAGVAAGAAIGAVGGAATGVVSGFFHCF